MPQLDQQPIPVNAPRPPAKVDLAHPRLGLALSGGGFRAAAFHLGTLAALDELGLLSQVSNLSTVSGGTVAGVSWVWYRAKHPAAPFQAFRDWFTGLLTSTTLDVEDVIVGALDPFHTDTDYLVRSYRKHFFGDDTLGVLGGPGLPRVCINSTSLNTGKNWKFHPDVMGDWLFCQNRPGATWQERFYPSKDVPIATAVAASSCFPPVFAPLLLPSAKYFPDKVETTPHVALCDGGLYDNQGLSALVYGALHGDACTHIIASDGAGPFAIENKPGTGQLVYVSRAPAIMMAKLRAFELQVAQLLGQATGAPRIAFFSLDSRLPSEPEALVQACDIPTRLKQLSAADVEALTTHARNLTMARVQKYLLAQPAEGGAATLAHTPAGTLQKVLDNPEEP
jgi:NTE family protein